MSYVSTDPRTGLNALVALPNVSAPCPVNTCPLTLEDGTVVCWPCLEAPPLGAAVDVPALDSWAVLVLGAALVIAAVVRLKNAG